MSFTPVEVFYSFAEADAPLLEQLEHHLSVLRKEGFISTWHRRQIVAGSDWQVEMDRHLSTASLILLLISPDFLASDYQYGVELQRSIQRYDSNQARVIPIVLRPCDWEGAPFARFQIVPRNGKAITAWRERDEAFAEIAKEIRATLQTVQRLTVCTPRSSLPKIWQVPYARNPFFTGRDHVLKHLHTRLQKGRTAAVGQPQSISGLGGIGKTQLAVEYAYRYYEEYQCVLWARAESIEVLTSSFTEIAGLLNLPEKDAEKQAITIEAVKRWLQLQRSWLLILDNADTPALLPGFLPPTVGGHLLITTRAAEVSAQVAGLTHSLVMENFSDEQGALFLLHRSGLLASSATLTQAEAHVKYLGLEISHELGGLPLALDQAGAYLKATGSSLNTYQQLYQQRRAQLLAQRRGADHPKPVTTTWNISFRNVEQQNPAAADLLRLCAFLAPDAIPEALLTESAEELGPILSPVASDPFLFNEAVENLLAYSLVIRNPHYQTITVHRLVQAVLRDSLSDEMQQQWTQRAAYSFFGHNILRPEEGPTHNILAISGPGGIGKSRLLGRLLDEAHQVPFKDYCLTAVVDERQTSPVGIMEHVARQLHLAGKFEKILQQYKEALKKWQVGYESSIDDLKKALVAELIDPVKKQQVEHEAFIDDLTRAFVAELNRLATMNVTLNSTGRERGRRIVLFFDTFENLAAEGKSWLLNYFLTVDIDYNVVLVIAGRDPIEHTFPDDRKKWLPYLTSGVIYKIVLNSFTEDETRMYLAKRGITDPDRIAEIWRLSRGFPLYLSMLTSNSQGIIDPTGDVVENFLRWIPKQEPLKRRLVLDAALLSRPFHQDDLEIFSYVSTSDQSALYQWLTSQPFVRNRFSDGRYLYHDLVRELFNSYLYQHSPKHYYEVREALAAYYQGLLEKTQVERGKNVDRFLLEEHLELLVALVFQLLLLPDQASHIKAAEYTLHAYKEYMSDEQDRAFVRVLSSLSQEPSSYPISHSARQCAIDLVHSIESLR